MSPAEENDLFYKNLGIAITQWAHVEMGLFAVFHVCLEPKDIESAAAVFFSTVTLQGKLDLIEKLLHLRRKSGSHLKKWNNLKERVRRQSKTRNHFAHYTVLIHAEARPGKRYQLRPVSYVKRSRDDQPTFYYANDFPRIWEWYSELWLELENFGAELSSEILPSPVVVQSGK